MSQLGQKEAVIAQVLAHQTNFQKHIDNAILVLSGAQLESIKGIIATEILAGNITYSKDIANVAEVRSYARSMVMNHIKKAKELNGGNSYVRVTPANGKTKTVRVKEKLAPKGVNPDLLPEELKEFVKTLI